MKGFDESYWKTNYSDPTTMDAVCNAKEHIDALKALLTLQEIEIEKLADFGFGLGHLFTYALKKFSPELALGLEPSLPAFKKIKKKIGEVSTVKDLILLPEDLLTWCQKDRPKKQMSFDLGICNSVFQYLPSDDLKKIVPILSQRVKFLYFSVPTDLELRRLKKEFDFVDPYALERSRDWYYDLLKPYFTFVSFRLLESKHFFNEQNSSFSDFIFRF